MEWQGLIHVVHVLRESTARVRRELYHMSRVTYLFKVTPVSVTAKYDSGALSGNFQ
jgi:hypothetical protein